MKYPFHFLFFLLLLANHSLFSATITWNGAGGNNNFSNALNWGGSTAADNDNLIFDGTSRLNPTNDNLTAITDITFNSGAGSFNINGNAFTLLGNITQNDDSSQIISTNIILNAGTRTIDVNSTEKLSLSGNLSGSGDILKTGTNDLHLTGNNSAATGNITISDGSLRIYDNNALGNTTGITTVTNGALKLSGSTSMTIAENITVSGAGIGGGAIITVDRTGSLTDIITGNITLAADSNLAVAGTTDTLEIQGIISDGGSGFYLQKNLTGEMILSAANTYTGATRITQGTLTISSDSNLGTAPGSPTSTHIRFAADSTLKTTATFTINSNRGMQITTTHGRIDVASGTTLTYNGTMDGPGNFTKTGTGTLSLGGANINTGTFTHNSGTILLNNSSGSATGTGALSISSGTTIGGTGSTSSNFTLASGITLSPGNTGSGSVGNLNFTGTPSAAWTANNSTYVWNLSDGGHNGTTLDGTLGNDWDAISFSNTLTIDTATLAANPMTIQIRNQNGTYQSLQGASTWANSPNYSGTGMDFKIMDNILFNGSGFSENYFTLDSDILNINWKLSYSGNALWLSYQAVPEPETYISLGSLTLAILFRFYKKKHSNTKS